MSHSSGSDSRIPPRVHAHLAGTIAVAGTVPALLVFLLVHPTEAFDSTMWWFLLFPLTCAIASGVFTPKIRRLLPESYPKTADRQRLRNVVFTVLLVVVFYVIAFFLLFVTLLVDSLVYSFDAYSPLAPSLYVVLLAVALVPIPSLHVRWKLRKATSDYAFQAKDRIVAAVLALLGGGFGLHKFYTGQRRDGVVYLLFCWTIVPWLLGLYAAFQYATMDPDDFSRALTAAYGKPTSDETGEPTPDGLDGSIPDETGEPSDEVASEVKTRPFGEAGDETPSSPGPSSSSAESSPPEQPSSPDERSSEASKVDELERLYALYEEGAITEDEYEQSKTELLDGS